MSPQSLLTASDCSLGGGVGGACQQHELRPNQLTNYECQKNKGGNRGCSAAARNKQHCFPASWEAQVQEPHRD